jgi:hypothetical protein
MSNLLQPLNLEPERKDKMERALTKIEQYNSGSGGQASSNNPNYMKKAGLDPLPQMDGL